MRELPLKIQMEYRAVSYKHFSDQKLKFLDPEDVCRKLKMCDPKDFALMLPRLSRNLKAIILRDE